MYTEYLMRALPAIAVKVSSNPDAYVYLAESIRAWPDQDHLAAWLQEAGWESVTYRNLSGGIVAVHRAQKPAGPATDPSAGRQRWQTTPDPWPSCAATSPGPDVSRSAS